MSAVLLSLPAILRCPPGACRKWSTIGVQAAAVIVPLLVVASPVLFVNHYVLGQLLVVPQGRNYLRPASPMIHRVPFSHRNGIFTYCPILLPALRQSLITLTPRRWMLAAMGMALLAQLYVNSIALEWWAATPSGSVA